MRSRPRQTRRRLGVRERHRDAAGEPDSGATRRAERIAISAGPSTDPIRAGGHTAHRVMTDRIKVVVWGPGRLGGFVLRVLLQRPDAFDVVGVFAFSAEKEGRDIGELVGLAPAGVT